MRMSTLRCGRCMCSSLMRKGCVPVLTGRQHAMALVHAYPSLLRIDDMLDSLVSFSCWRMHTLWTLCLTARICMHTLTACQKGAFLTMCHFQEGQAQGLVALPHRIVSCWLLAVTADPVPKYMVQECSESKGLACRVSGLFKPQSSQCTVVCCSSIVL